MAKEEKDALVSLVQTIAQVADERKPDTLSFAEGVTAGIKLMGGGYANQQDKQRGIAAQ